MPLLNRAMMQRGQRPLQPRVTLNIKTIPGKHGDPLSAVHVPAGRVTTRTDSHKVGDFYLTDPARVGHVQVWANEDGQWPFVRFAMETAKSPHRPGELHVVQMGSDPTHMDDLEPILDYDLDAALGHVELVGTPIDVLTRYKRLSGDSEEVMRGLSLFEQSALAAHLNRWSMLQRAAAHLGALTLATEAQIVHAGTNYSQLFEGSQRLLGMPESVGHLTRDLGDPNELDLPAEERINALRVWRGGDHHVGGPLPVADRDYDDGLEHDRLGYDVARFVVLPLPQDLNP